MTPVFASEEEALAAAGAAYQRYLDVSNAIGQAGWVDTAGYAEVERGEALDQELEAAGSLGKSGYHQVGASTFDSLVLQQIDDQGAGNLSIATYLCLDVTAVEVIDANGQSVVSPARPNRQALEVVLDDADGSIKVSRSDAWSGANFC